MTASVRAGIWAGGVVTHELTANIGGGEQTVTVSSPLTLDDLLSTFSTGIAALLGTTFTIAYSPTLDRVTITCGATVTVTMDARLARWLGMGTSHSGSASYTGAIAPIVAAPLTGADVQPVRYVDRAEITRYRLGQALATAWTQVPVRTVELVARDDAADRLDGWLCRGLLTITDAADNEVSGWVVDAEDLQTDGEAEQYTIRRLTLIDAPSVTPSAYSSIWGAVAWGWHVVYSADIDGIGTLVERITDDTPAGAIGCLSIDDSAELGVDIDRKTGIGAGMSMTFEVRDCAASRAWFTKPGNTARVASVYSGGGTLTVDSTSGWSSSGTLYIGAERYTYSGKTGTTFTGMAKQDSSLRKSYGSTPGLLSIVADAPLFWRGRRVMLGVTLVCPDAVGPGEDVYEELWYGEVESEPLRRRTGWVVEAKPVDRIITREVAGVVAGEVESQDVCITSPGTKMAVRVRGRTLLGVGVFDVLLVLDPFDGLLPEVIDWSLFAERLRTEWDAAVTAASAGSYIDSAPILDPVSPWGFQLRIPLLYDASYQVVSYEVQYGDGPWSGPANLVNMPSAYGLTEGYTTEAVIGWWDSDLSRAWIFNSSASNPYLMRPAALLRLDSEIDSVDRVRVVVGDLTVDCTCKSLLGSDGRMAIYYMQALNGGQIPASLLGVTMRIGEALISADGVGLVDLSLQMLASTGAGNNSAADELPAPQGYAIPDTMLLWDRFGSLGEGDASTIDALSCDSVQTIQQLPDKISIADLLGGLLALRRLALVSAVYNGRVILRIVDTGPGASSWVREITDSDLIGFSEEPAESVERLRAPNIVQLSGGEGVDPVVIRDPDAIGAEGAEEWSLEVPTGNRADLVALALRYATTLVTADRCAVAARITVPPWIAVSVGDAIRLSTRHPALWDAARGVAGYDGVARVVGASRELRTGIQRLTLLLDGWQATTAICPAWRVDSWDGDPDDASAIYVTQPAALTTWPLPYILTMIERGGGTADLLYYEPGINETPGGSVTISTADADGSAGSVRLITAGMSATLAAGGWLTFPQLGQGSAWQDGHAHVDDGSRWGG